MKKMGRNMLALQQCVKSIVHDAPDGEFLRARQYYSLFSLHPRVRQGTTRTPLQCHLKLIFPGYARIYPQATSFHV